MDAGRREGRVSVVVADDHPDFRRALRGLVGEVTDLVVVGEAPDGASAVRLAEELQPDVVLMDLHMPGMDGIAATAEIMKLEQAPSVIVLTASSVSSDVLEAITAGATGYLLKGASAVEIDSAVHAALEGGAPLVPNVAGALLEYVRERRADEAAPEPLPPLTDRERKVLELLALGRGNNEIAEELYVSVATVKNCMTEMFAKLEVTSRAQAAVRAVRAGLV